MSRLDDLRQEIDGIDVALHDLLMRRVEIGRQVAEAKGKDRGPYFRPGREAQIIRCLVARNESRLKISDIDPVLARDFECQPRYANPCPCCGLSA